MALIDNYLKKKDQINIDRPRTLLIDRYTKKKEISVAQSIPVVQPIVEQKSISLLDRAKSFGRGALQFGARVGIEASNLITSTLDFTADFLASDIERKLKGKPSITPIAPGFSIPIKTKFGENMANRWKNFYSSTTGAVTEKMKTFTEDLREVEFIQPSKEWTNASNKEKFTKKLPETVLTIGPGLVASLGMFALNPAIGFVASAGSVADEIKTIAIDNGVNKERAEFIGLGTGLLIGFIDKIVPDEIFSPQQKKIFMSGIAKRILKTGLKEAGTEVAQEDIQLLVESTIREDLGMNEVVTRNLMSGLGGLLGGTGTQTTVSFVNGIRSGDIGGLEEDYVKSTVKEDQQISNVDSKKIIQRKSVDKNRVEIKKVDKKLDKESLKMIVELKKEYGVNNLIEAKKELGILENKIEVEKKRLDKIDPNRQITSGTDVENLSSSDQQKFTRLNNFIVRQENFRLGDPKERVKIKRQLTKENIKFDKNASMEELKKLIKKLKGKIVTKKPVSDVETKTNKEVESQVKKVKLITEKSVQNVKNIKDVKTTLKTIRKNFADLTLQIEGESIVAQQQREGVNVENINKLKRIYAVSKKFQEGDIETIRASKHKDLVNGVIENVQEIHPEMDEQEAFEFALDLPTQVKAQRKTTAETRELAKKEKILSKFLDTLRAKQKVLDIKQDDALFKQWQAVVDAQEKLIQSIKVSKRQLPVGKGKEKVSRLQARLKGVLKKTSKEDIEELGLTTFRQMNQKDQIARATEYVENNTEEALRVVRGEIDPPEGILQNSIFAALTELGTEDTDVATKVATLTATRFGQEINILKKILADNPVVMMQDIVETRIEAYEQRTGNKANKRVKIEIKKIAGKTKPTTKEQWNTFIESIRC